MTERKYQALMRMKCRARGVVSQGEHSLRLHELNQQGQRAALEEMYAQTTQLGQLADQLDDLSRDYSTIARNSTIIAIAAVGALITMIVGML
jgi:uncharacterized protein YbjQ (UPF0145 family)